MFHQKEKSGYPCFLGQILNLNLKEGLRAAVLDQDHPVGVSDQADSVGKEAVVAQGGHSVETRLDSAKQEDEAVDLIEVDLPDLVDLTEIVVAADGIAAAAAALTDK